MIRTLYYSQAGEVRTDVQPQEFGALLQDASGLLWVDLEAEPAEVCDPILWKRLAFTRWPWTTPFRNRTCPRWTTGDRTSTSCCTPSSVNQAATNG